MTENEDLARELRNNQAELRQILDFAPQFIAVYGPDRDRLHINRIALDYLGVSHEEWRQTRDRGAFVHPDDRAREQHYLDGALSRESPYELELRLRKCDGSYHWFLVRYNLVRDDEGRIRRWYVACSDIEDRKRAEERL
ncbi:MAG TPA: PAS domain-containing protein, partial [Bryobacteraceae bacterium]|nr:PAS domain-containing protein [Bryobacteraceae bacterium]